MNVYECVKKSIYITTEYYNNDNTEPYFEHLDEHVIWHGIAIGQKITGLDNIRKIWASFPNTLHFSIGDIEVQYIQTSPLSCEVMLMYIVTVCYPNDDTFQVFQRLHLSWADISVTNAEKQKKRIPKIFMVHISNPIEYHSDDYIYPEHYNELYKQMSKPIPESYLHLRGTDNNFYVISVNSIIWAESTANRLCLIHQRDKILKVKTTITEIEKQTEGLLIRVHSGYIVNPNDVVSIWRFKVSLSDGAMVPIPEKKYTAIKKLLLNK